MMQAHENAVCESLGSNLYLLIRTVLVGMQYDVAQRFVYREIELLGGIQRQGRSGNG